MKIRVHTDTMLAEKFGLSRRAIYTFIPMDSVIRTLQNGIYTRRYDSSIGLWPEQVKATLGKEMVTES